MKDKTDLPLAALAADFKKTAGAVARAAVGRMNVVTREEFEAQNAILAQAITDMHRIEKKLDALTQARPATNPPGKKQTAQTADKKF